MSKVEATWAEHRHEFETLAAASQRSVPGYEVAAVNALREARLASTRQADARGDVGELWRARAAILERAYRQCGLDAWDGPSD